MDSPPHIVCFKTGLIVYILLFFDFAVQSYKKLSIQNDYFFPIFYIIARISEKNGAFILQKEKYLYFCEWKKHFLKLS